NFKRVLILGVGGSSLGGKTLTAVKSHIARNHSQNSSPIEIDFVESIDSNTIKNKFCNLSKSDLKNTLFLVISKSGETIETICQTLIAIDCFKVNRIAEFANN